MKIFADLHLHSKYSRATSKNLSLENLEEYARKKGLGILGTGDFTHPLWINELREGLHEDSTGILKTESGFSFVLQAEVSNIYSQGGRLRRIHNALLAPSFEVIEQVNETLSKYGKLESDGRPIFGSKMNCVDLVEMLKEISDDIEVIPAHIWTPWFSLFGSMSGFDSIEECFGDQAKHIHAIETGLSSDPEMNWRLSALDNITLLSNSDAHSYWPWRIGRECNLFDIEPTYKDLIKAIRTRKGLVETIEVDPSYGKYHLDGHRNCKISLDPVESIKRGNICPVCGKDLTIGVLHRVEELSDRPAGFVREGAVPFRRVLPLSELIATAVGVNQPYSKKVFSVYNKLIAAFGNELEVLLNAGKEKLEKVVEGKVLNLILKNREGQIEVDAGYDGVYGKMLSDKNNNKKKYEEDREQKHLNEF